MKINKITDMITPCSELGRIAQKVAEPYTMGMERELRDEYALIARMTAILSADQSCSLSLQAYLQKINNITNLTQSLANLDRPLEADEIFEIKQFTFLAEKIRLLLQKYNLGTIAELESLEDLFAELDPDKLDSPVFSISSAYSEKLTSLRAERYKVQMRMKNLKNRALEDAREKLDLALPEQHIVVSRGNKELLDKLTNSQLYYISDENFVNVTFALKSSDDLIKAAKEIRTLKEKMEQEEKDVRIVLTKKIKSSGKALSANLGGIAKLDLLRAKAVFGMDNGCLIPEIRERKGDFVLSLSGAVNLPLRTELHSQGIEYQPVDMEFDGRVNVLTGANMAGKTTLLETIGQISYLIAYAIPVPCRIASVSLVDTIFTNNAVTENRSDLSSFAAELVAFNEALHKKRGRGLFLIDEFANGTNPVEGEAFASAVLEYFSENREPDDIVVAATHFTVSPQLQSAGHFRIAGISEAKYDELHKALNDDKFKAENSIAARLEELHKYMDYRLHRVKSNDTPPQAAMMIAEILGIDDKILKKVQAKLKKTSRQGKM